MTKQKFHYGDICKLTKAWDFEYEKGDLAFILGSYEDLYPGEYIREATSYNVRFLKDSNECAWVEQKILKFVRTVDRKELLKLKAFWRKADKIF